MVARGGVVYHVDKSGVSEPIDIEIRNAKDALAGSLRLHAAQKADGTIRAQFELRSSDFAGPNMPAGTRVYAERSEVGRPWIVVPVGALQGDTNTVRLCFDIPGQASDTRADIRASEAETTAVESARSAIYTVRGRCRYSGYCTYPVCAVATDGSMRQLADDRCIASLVTVQALSDDSQNPSSQ
jgi:hypothetical protein